MTVGGKQLLPLRRRQVLDISESLALDWKPRGNNAQIVRAIARTAQRRPEMILKLHIGLFALLLAAAGASAADLNPAALAYKSPDQLKWRDPTGGAGINQAVLVGDPEKPGLYVVMNRFKPGNFSRPHFHPNDRFITVIKGTWWVATGNKFDPGLTVPMPTGSFVTHFAKQVHWDGAKDEEAWLIIVGEGPATLTRVEEAK